MSSFKEPEQAAAKSITAGNPSITTLSFNEEGRSGIIEIMFNLDQDLVEWIASTFWDGKVKYDENGKPYIMPNVDYYLCPTCNTKKSTSLGITNLYASCRGTPEKPHELIGTVPLEWRPKVSKTGLGYLVGKLHAKINPNIKTGNFSKTATDAKNHAEQEDIFKWISFKSAVADIDSLLANAQYIAPWIMEDINNLPVVFNIGFLSSVKTEYTLNIWASMSKGKNLEAVGKVLENRAHIEQEISNKTERAETEHSLSQKSGGLGDLFSFGNK